MRKPLGSWVWCDLCRSCCAYGRTTANEHAAHALRIGWQCHPRLTLAGRIRYLLGLPIGEEEK